MSDGRDEGSPEFPLSRAFRLSVRDDDRTATVAEFSAAGRHEVCFTPVCLATLFITTRRQASVDAS